MAITNATVVPKVIAAGFLKEYERQRVYAQRTTNAYRNLLNNAGDKIIINRPGAATVGDYTKSTVISYSDADVGTPLEISMDKTKYWAIQFNDLDRAVSRLDVLADAVTEHSRVLAETVDADIRAKMIGSGGAADAGAVTFDSSPSNTNTGLELLGRNFAKWHRLMDLENIPRAGRWLICGPYFAEYVMRLTSREAQLVAGAPAQGLINGSLGSFRGFQVYRDSGVNSDFKATQVTEGGVNKKANSARETLIFGTDRATAFMDQIRKTERMRSPSSFSDQVRGLYHYGSAIVRSNELWKAVATIEKIGVTS